MPNKSAETLDINVTSNTEEVFSSFDKEIKKFGRASSETMKKLYTDMGLSFEEVGKQANKGSTLMKKTSKTYKDVNELLKGREYLEENTLKSLKNIKKESAAISKSLADQIRTGQVNTEEYKKTLERANDLAEISKDIITSAKSKVDIEKMLSDIEDKSLHGQVKALKIQRILVKEKRKEKALALKKAGVGSQGFVGFLQRRSIAKKEVEMPKGASRLGILSKALEPMKALPKVFGKLTKAITTMMPALSTMVVAFGGIAAFGAAMLMAEKAIKGAQREILAMAAETGELEKQIIGVGGAVDVAGSKVNIWRKKTESYVNVFGIAIEESRRMTGELVKAGFTMSETFETVGKSGVDNFSKIYSQSVLAGKSFEEMAGLAGTLRAEFGSTIDQATDAFIAFRKGAAEAGIHTSRFMDKVMNISSGLGIYGTKIADISAGFAGLTKNMRLPEKAATEAAARMIGGFKDLSTEQQILVGQTSKYSAKVEKLLVQARDLNSAEGQKAVKVLEKMGIDESAIAKLEKITDPLNRQIAIMRSLRPVEQFKARFDALTKAAGISIDINNDSIGKIDSVLQNNTYALEKAGETFGFSKEDIIAIQSLSAGLAENKKAQFELTKSVKDQAKWAKVLDPKAMLSGMKAAGLGDLADKMKDSITLARKKGETDSSYNRRLIDQYKEFITKQNTNFKELGGIQKALEKERQNAEDAKLAKQMRLQTRSMYDALEQNIAKILNNIYDAVSPIVKTLVEMLSPMWRIMKKGFLAVVKGLNWISGGKFDAFIMEQEIDLETSGIEDLIKITEKYLEVKERELTTTNRDIKKLKDKKAAVEKLDAAEEKLLKTSEERKKQLDEELPKQRTFLADQKKRFADAEANAEKLKVKIKTEPEFVKTVIGKQKEISEREQKLSETRAGGMQRSGLGSIFNPANKVIAKINRFTTDLDEYATETEQKRKELADIKSGANVETIEKASKLRETIKSREEKIAGVEGRGKQYDEKLGIGVIFNAINKGISVINSLTDVEEFKKETERMKKELAILENKKFKVEETPVLVENSPVHFKLEEPGMIEDPKLDLGLDTMTLLESLKPKESEVPVSDVPEVPTDIAVPETDAEAKLGEQINDNRTINIYVNHKDKDYITQVVRNEMYTTYLKK